MINRCFAGQRWLYGGGQLLNSGHAYAVHACAVGHVHLGLTLRLHPPFPGQVGGARFLALVQLRLHLGQDFWVVARRTYAFHAVALGRMGSGAFFLTGTTR